MFVPVTSRLTWLSFVADLQKRGRWWRWHVIVVTGAITPLRWRRRWWMLG